MPSPNQFSNVDQESVQETTDSKRYLTDYRLILAVVGLGMGLFLPVAEIAIVSTSLVTISFDLDGFNKSSWIVTAYLSAFTGSSVIWSKLGSSFGLKPALLVSGLLYIAFSAGCGASKSMNELIIFRAMQGIGGAGLYILPNIAFFQLVPPEQYIQINTVSSSIMTVAFAVSPLIGGAISQTGDWRWIFYLNLPIGALALVLITLTLPARFPNHCDPPPEEKPTIWSIGVTFVKNLDPLGAFLILGATVLLVAALEEGGVQFAWNAAATITMFATSASLWIIFALWQWYAGRPTCQIEVMFPRNLAKNQVFWIAIFGCFLCGACMTIATIELPQRYQLINETSSFGAGVKLLAYAVPMPAGVFISSILIGKSRVPFVCTLLIGATLQSVGFALMSTVPTTKNIWAGQYGYSVIVGLGVGISAGTYYIITPIASDKKDQHIAVGLGLQARMLGGAVGLAVMSNVWQSFVRLHLRVAFSEMQIQLLLGDIGTLSMYPTADQAIIRSVCGNAYNLQMRASLGFAVTHFLLVLALWRKSPLRLSAEGALAST